MEPLSRRDALARLATAAGMVPIATTISTPGLAAQQPQQDDAYWRVERQKVIEAGMTSSEADCWVLSGRLAGALFALPQLHEMQGEEVSHIMHQVQYRILARPTYRRYKEISKRTPQN